MPGGVSHRRGSSASGAAGLRVDRVLGLGRQKAEHRLAHGGEEEEEQKGYERGIVHRCLGVDEGVG